MVWQLEVYRLPELWQRKLVPLSYIQASYVTHINTKLNLNCSDRFVAANPWDVQTGTRTNLLKVKRHFWQHGGIPFHRVLPSSTNGSISGNT